MQTALVKMMSRALKLETCQEETLKILALINSFTQAFATQVSRLKAFSEFDPLAYSQLLSLASQILRKISSLQSNEHLMRRPFVFGGEVYDLRHGREFLKDRLHKFRAKAEKITRQKIQGSLDKDGTIVM